MIRVTKLTSESSEIQVSFVQAGTSVLNIYNVYGVTVETIPLFNYKDGTGKFRLTDTTHALPFGRYIGEVKTGNCSCGCFPIEIPSCNISTVVIKDIENKDCIEDRPVRECAEIVCSSCSQCSCDQCTGCEECSPCDICNPCYDDRAMSLQEECTPVEESEPLLLSTPIVQSIPLTTTQVVEEDTVTPNPMLMGSVQPTYEPVSDVVTVNYVYSEEAQEVLNES